MKYSGTELTQCCLNMFTLTLPESHTGKLPQKWETYFVRCVLPEIGSLVSSGVDTSGSSVLFSGY